VVLKGPRGAIRAAIKSALDTGDARKVLQGVAIDVDPVSLM